MKNILFSLLFYFEYTQSFSVSLPGFNKAIISNIDIKKITKNDKIKLKTIFSKVPLLIFKNQNINPQEYYDFCKIFDNNYNNDTIHLFPKCFSKTPQIGLITNIKGDIDIYNIKDYNDYFSQDINYSIIRTWQQDIVGKLNVLPSVVSSLYSPITPVNNKAFTQFANLEDAYDKIDIKLKKKIYNYNVLYNDHLSNNNKNSNYDNNGLHIFNTKEKFDLNNVKKEPFIIYSDNTKTRKSLLLNPAKFLKFDKLNIEDSVELYRNILKNYILTNDNIINHVWEKNDLVIWNNRKFINTGSPSIEYKNEDRLALVLFLGTNEPIISVNDNKLILKLSEKKKKIIKYINKCIDNIDFYTALYFNIFINLLIYIIINQNKLD